MIKLEKNLDPDFYHTFYPKEAEHKEAIIWKALCQDGKEEYSRWLGSKIFEQKPELKEQAEKGCLENGLTLEEATVLFFEETVRLGRLPFELDEELREYMVE